jgi:hypothetical protein
MKFSGCGPAISGNGGPENPHRVPIHAADVVGGHARERVVGVGQRQRVGVDPECVRHVRARDQQAAEQNLGKDDGEKELDGLELRLRERAQEQTQRLAKPARLRSRACDGPPAAIRVHVEGAEANKAGDRTLDRPEEREGASTCRSST